MDGRVVVLSSPLAGSACPADQVIRALEAEGLSVARSVAVTELPPEPLGAAWIAEGITTVVAAGGDGTVGAAATHIGGSGLHLGILPLGTANDTARSLAIPLELGAAAAVVARGKPVGIDVGVAADARGGRARFLHAATLGLNAEFARLATDAERRRRLGPLAVPSAALAALASARTRHATVRLDDGTVVEGPTLLVAVLNLPHLFGGTLPVTLPDVGPRDGKLVVLVARGLRIERHEARAVRLETAGPEGVTVDGEPLLTTPVDVELAPRRLRVLLPA